MRRAVLAAGLVAVAAGCGGHGAIERTQLVYSVPTSFSGKHAWIWRAQPDGTHRVRLVKGHNPQLAPNGRLVAYTRSPRELFVVPTSGGKPRRLRRLARDKPPITGIVWSPTSRQIVTLEATSLVLVYVETGRARTFAKSSKHLGVVGDPSFSPDGSRIAFDRADPTGGDLDIFDTRTGRTRKLTSDHRSMLPAWGARGIAFSRFGRVCCGDVWLLDPRTSRSRRLTHTRAGIYPVAWSADGTRLLAANPAAHNGRLWAVDVRSGRARNLTGWVGDLFPQGLSRDGKTILAAIGCGALISPFGLVETLPFAGGRAHVIVKGPCRASWND